MTQLYKLAGEYLELQALAEDADEGLALAVRDTLEAIGGEFNAKAQAVATIAINMGSTVDAIELEIARLAARKQQIRARQDSMKEYLRENMEATGITKISCPLFSITCVQGREIAAIDAEDQVPDEYMRVKTEIAPDKNAIAAALKEGKEVPGAHLERAKSSIRIK